MAPEPSPADDQPVVRGLTAEASGAAGERRGRAVLYGVGRDGDGHLRITTGSGYCLTGGTADTHQTMSERAEWFMAELGRRGYSLDNLTRSQAEEVARLVERIRP